LNVLAYDASGKAYTECSFSSFGEAEYDRGGSASVNAIFVIGAATTTAR
jgi:hypothetical protein